MKNDETEARRIALGRAPRAARLHTWKLTLEYDGSRYSGWAEQRNARTVMGELRLAAEKSLGRAVELVGAGRTDAGVHALGQVAHVRAELADAPPDLEQLLLALNEALPYDITVLAVEPASNYFHARHDALRRTYVYRIAKQKDAFSKKFVWWIKEPLDIAAMRQAVALLPGRHDFVLFLAADAALSGRVHDRRGRIGESRRERAAAGVPYRSLAFPVADGAAGDGGGGSSAVGTERRAIPPSDQCRAAGGRDAGGLDRTLGGLVSGKGHLSGVGPSAPAGATPATRAGAGRTTRRGPARRG